MIPVLSRAQMRAFDTHAIETCKVPSLVLMENAGRGAADVIERDMLGGRAEGKRVVMVCGTGNNGGDGFVVARHLLSRGARVEAWLAGDNAKMTPDCNANHEAFVGLGGRVAIVKPQALDPLRVALAGADVVVDALFGTGLDRPIGALFAGVVGFVNDARARKVALDVSSGMNADTGVAMGTAVRADLTVTFAHLKLGHVTGSGAHLSGIVKVVDIGVPASLRADHAAGLTEARDVRALLRPRPVDSHKYKAGHVAVLAGSKGKVGAALLASHGALRGGAGAATIVTWADAAAAVQSRVVEVMTAELNDETPLGEQLDARLEHKRAVVIGPGFGLDDRAREAVKHVLANYKGPIVGRRRRAHHARGRPRGLRGRLRPRHPHAACRRAGAPARHHERGGRERSLRRGPHRGGEGPRGGGPEGTVQRDRVPGRAGGRELDGQPGARHGRLGRHPRGPDGRAGVLASSVRGGVVRGVSPWRRGRRVEGEERRPRPPGERDRGRGAAGAAGSAGG